MGTTTGREADEIEITAEMIAAGVDELMRHDIMQPTREELSRALRSAISAVFGPRLKFSS